MRKRLHWVLTASLGLSSAAFVGCERNNSGTPQASNTPSNTDKTAQDSKIINNKSDAARTAGINIPGDQIGTADLTKIYGVLGNVAEDAFKKSHFDNLVSELSAPDQDRIGKQFANQKFDDLDGRIDQLQKDFKAKYNDNFSLNDSKVFENWAQVQKTGENADKTFCNVMIPASHGLPALTVPMVKDNQAFRVNVPDELTGQQLKQNMLDHLTAIDNTKDQWPTNKLDAQREIVHHVFMAVLNKPVTK
ncbi:MAG TPA: hypothetical protein VH475_13860 [Tepidisphaeraceae bacterium]